MIKVLLADGHPVMQNVLARFLSRAGDMQIVAVARDGAEAVSETVTQSPDVVAVDISMPIIDGIEVTKQIRAECSQTRVLILSGFSDAELVQRALQAGATGYVLKDFLAWDLVLAIRSLYQGKPYFSNQIAKIANAYIQLNEEVSSSGDTSS